MPESHSEPSPGDLSTVLHCTFVQYFCNVEKKIYPPNTGTASLTEIDKIIILETDTADFNSGHQYNLEVFETRQKMVLVASELLRAEYEYLLDMQVFRGHPQMFVFVDETGAATWQRVGPSGLLQAGVRLPQLAI